MRLDLDTEIRFPDGVRAGVLQKAVVGGDGRVDSVVMSTAEIVSRDLIVPVSTLSEGPGDVLTINLTPDQVSDLPDYNEELIPAAPEGWQWSDDPLPGADVFPGTLYDPGMMPVTEIGNVPEGSIPLSQGTQIWCEGDRWGIVDEILLDDSGNITAFIGRPDNVEEHDRVIPVDLVSEYGSDAVTLNCTLADLPNMTEETVNEFEEPDAE